MPESTLSFFGVSQFESPHLALVLRIGRETEHHFDKACLQTGRTEVFAELRVRGLQRRINYGELRDKQTSSHNLILLMHISIASTSVETPDVQLHPKYESYNYRPDKTVS